MKKGTLTSRVVQYTPAAVLYSTLSDCILRSKCLVFRLIIMLLVNPPSHKHVRPETVVALCFFPPRRDTVTTGKGLVLPLDKLKLLVSNFGSILMAPLL